MTRLDRGRLQEILAHATEAYPQECCGFLIGHVTDGVRRVVEVRRAGNVRSDSPRNRYQISPEEFREGERDSRLREMEIVGFYHSHPDVAASPSDYDRDHAWPWYVYLITSVVERKAHAPMAWVLDDSRSRFRPEALDPGE